MKRHVEERNALQEHTTEPTYFKKCKLSAHNVPPEVWALISRKLEEEGDPTFISCALTCKDLFVLLGKSTREEFKKSIHFCSFFASKAYFNLTKWALQQHYPVDNNVCIEAARFSEGLAFLKDCALSAARMGHVETLKWLFENLKFGQSMSRELLSQAIGGSRMNVITWLTENPNFCNPVTIDNQSMAESRDPQIWKWIAENLHKNAWSLMAVMNFAGAGGNLGIIHWLLENFESRFMKEIRNGAKIDLQFPTLSHHTHVIYFWVEKSREFALPLFETADLVYAASCTTHNTELVAWLRNHGFPWNGRECGVAAQRGDLEMLSVLRSGTHPAPWSSADFCEAAEHGSVDGLRWLKKNGCPTGNILGKVTSLELLKFAVEEMGEQWDTFFIPRMLSQRIDKETAEECILWALEKGCPWGFVDLSCYRNLTPKILKMMLDQHVDIPLSCSGAIIHQNIKILQFLHQNNLATFNLTIKMSTSLLDCLPLIKWAVAHGCKMEDMSPFIQENLDNFELLKFNYEMGFPISSSHVKRALWNHDVQILDWMVKQGVVLSEKMREYLLRSTVPGCVTWVKKTFGMGK
eukprot:TRINITY_DN5456_c0_g1_i4.p1 TRINITY_DN5456_c0_g1~~TRINITY_DN5456_c0_g1_i4.p1  ORF type:complete len:588 (-),score=82.32 TRINITY_DN5456_c0_g1_i4:390-2126(-)